MNRALVIAASLVLVGCGEAGRPPKPGRPPGPPSLVTGMVAFSQQTSLPRGAVVRVSLIDASRPNPAESVVTEQISRVDDPAEPLSFALRFRPGAFDGSHRYVVQARILIDDQVRYASQREFPVLTGGAGDHVVVVVEPAAGAP